jgi:uncharacterized protein
MVGVGIVNAPTRFAKFYSRFDGFMNVLSGLGAPGLDRTMSTMQTSPQQSRFGHRYSHLDLGELYLSNGLAQKVIDRPSDDAVQKGIEIEGDEDDLMSDEYDRLQVMAKLANALRWSRLFGGAVLLLIAKDGGDLYEPLNLNALETIEEIRVYDVTAIRGTDRYYEDVNDPTTYGKMEFYELIPPGVQSVIIHETRIITIGGEPIPTRYGFSNSAVARLPWVGRSVLESCAADIVRYQQGLEWSLRLLERKQQAVYNMAGLAEMFQAGDDEAVKKRIALVDMVRSNLTSIVVDKEDTFTVLTAGMDGIDSTLKEYQIALAASSNIPVMILFGEQGRGLANSGAGNLESYYGMVAHIQSVIARPALEKLTSILWVQQSLPGKIPDKWKIEFNPLWIATELENAQTELNKAQANSTEVAMLVSLMTEQILAPEEVRKIVVEKYSDYDFPDGLPSIEGDLGYAAGVDPTLMDVPNDPNAKGTKPTPPPVAKTNGSQA